MTQSGSVTQAEIKSAAESVRIVMHALPIEFVITDLCPTDHLMHAWTILQVLSHEDR